MPLDCLIYKLFQNIHLNKGIPNSPLVKGRSYIERYTLGGRRGQEFYRTSTADKVGEVQLEKECVNLNVTPLIWSSNNQNNKWILKLSTLILSTPNHIFGVTYNHMQNFITLQ